MQTDPNKNDEGWAWPPMAKKAHYFVGSRALCGSWAWFGKLEQGKDDSPDNCRACKRKMEKRRATSTP